MVQEAERLGYANHAPVSRRLQGIRRKVERLLDLD